MDSAAIHSELEEGFARMFTDEESHRTQEWIDWLDEITGLLHSKSEAFRRALQKLRHLCSRSLLLPRDCYIPNDIELPHNIAISQGGFSDVYQGIMLGRPVALKVLRVHLDDQARVGKVFCQEVIVWRRFSHPNIVRFLGVSRLFPFCLVSEWMSNGSIRSFINLHPDHDRTPWIADTARGLQYMHSLGLVHGDLKGANVLINDSLQACLADFGLAAVMHHTSILTTQGTQIGSVRWMAPEVLNYEGTDEAQGLHTMASDIYSLAMLWWEIFTGEVPFRELRHDVQVMLKIVQGQRPPRPSNAEPRNFVDFLWPIMERCWKATPSARPSIESIVHLVENWSTQRVAPQPAVSVQWDAITSEPMQTSLAASRIPAFYGRKIAFSPDGRYCAFSCHTGEVQLWGLSLTSFFASPIETAADDHVTALAFSQDGSNLAVATMRYIQMWDTQSGNTQDHPIILRDGWLAHSVAFSRIQAQLIAVIHDLQSDESCVRIWDTRNRSLLLSTETHPGSPSAPIAISAESAFVAFAVGDRALVYSLLSMPLQLANSWTLPSTLLLALSLSGKTLNYIRGTRWDAELWASFVDRDSNDMARDVKLTGPADRSWRRGQPTCACYSADGELVAAGYDGGHIQVFRVDDGTPMPPILEDISQVAIISVAFHPTSSHNVTYLASVDADGNCRLWHIPSGRPALTMAADGNLHGNHERLQYEFGVPDKTTL